MDFEELFVISIMALIERNGGSLEETLDEMKITSKTARRNIKKYLEWED